MPLYNSYTPPIQVNKGAPASTYTASAKTVEINTTAQTIVDGNGYGQTPIVILSKQAAFGGALAASNTSNSGSASTDIICYNDTGSQFANYIDIGVNSSTFNDPLYTWNGANSPYILGNGGVLAFGVGTAHDMTWTTGGTLTANEKMRLKNAGNLILNSVTPTPAGGASAAMLQFGTTTSFGIYFGSGVPTVSAAQGSLYLRSDGSSTLTRMYVNTNGTTGWTNLVTTT